MAGIRLKFKGPGWTKAQRILDPQSFDKRLKKNVGRAMERSLKRAEAASRKTMRRRGALTRNAALTIAIKGSSKPLIDNGDLFKAVTSKKVRWNLGFTGILRKNEMTNIAKLLHDGGTIPVTEKMRGLFWVLALASWAERDGHERPMLTGRAAELFERYQGWWPLRSTTRAIVIPPRPWFTITMRDKALVDKISMEFAAAVEQTMKGK